VYGQMLLNFRKMRFLDVRKYRTHVVYCCCI